jgi:hypothetical protein
VGTPTLSATGTWGYVASGSITPSLAAHAVGDMLIARVAYKSSAIATCLASTATSGWAKLGEFHNGTSNSGNGTGSMAVAAFWKVATATTGEAPTIDFSQTVTQVGAEARAYALGSGDTAWITPVGDGGGDTAAGTSHSATIQSHVSITAGDLIDFFTGICDDTTMTVPTFTQTGATLAAVVESPAAAGIDTSGADGAYDGGYRTVSSGTSSAAAVVTSTLSTSETGASWQTRLRSFAPETHSGSVGGTGGGTATLSGAKGGKTTITGTGGGTATLAASKQGKTTVSVTGGGVATLAASTARSGTVSGTGGGVAVIAGATNRYGALMATGGGVAVATGQKAAFATVTATGGGVATIMGEGGTPAEEHSGSVSATGGGVATLAVRKGALGIMAATGGGVAVLGGAKAAFASVSATGGGTAAIAALKAAFASITATGGGVAAVAGGSNIQPLPGSIAAVHTRPVPRHHIGEIAIAWAADGLTGAIPAAPLPVIEGILVHLMTTPGSPAPSAYDVTVRDREDVDRLHGSGLGRSATEAEATAIVYPGVAVSPPVSLTDVLALHVDGNAVGGAAGQIVLVYRDAIA